MFYLIICSIFNWILNEEKNLIKTKPKIGAATFCQRATLSADNRTILLNKESN